MKHLFFSLRYQKSSIVNYSQVYIRIPSRCQHTTHHSFTSNTFQERGLLFILLSSPLPHLERVSIYYDLCPLRALWLFSMTDTLQSLWIYLADGCHSGAGLMESAASDSCPYLHPLLFEGCVDVSLILSALWLFCLLVGFRCFVWLVG